MDIVLVGFIAGLTFGGFRTGLILRLFGLLFIAISFVLGAYLRGAFGALVTSIFKDIPPDYASLVGYTFAFPVILATLHLVTYPFLKRFHPQGLTKELDRGLGALFGFIEAVLILSVVVVIFDAYFVKGLETGSTAGPRLLHQPRLGHSTSRRPSTSCAQTTVPLVLTVLGPLLPKDISSLIPSGVPGLPGLARRTTRSPAADASTDGNQSADEADDRCRPPPRGARVPGRGRPTRRFRADVGRADGHDRRPRDGRRRGRGLLALPDGPRRHGRDPRGHQRPGSASRSAWRACRSDVGITGVVAATRKPTTSFNVHRDRRFHWIRGVDEPQFTSMCSVPLIWNDSVVGVLNVQTVRQREFTKRDVSFLETLAALMAGTVERNRLHREAEAQLESLRAIDEARAGLVAVVTHALRTPLAVVRAYVELLGGAARRVRRRARCRQIGSPPPSSRWSGSIRRSIPSWPACA